MIDDPRVATVIALMQDNLCQVFQLEELGQVVNLSARQLERIFKAATGFAPMQFLHQMRLAKARQLLASTFLSVKEIVARVGLTDISHFRRDFKQVYDVTPQKFRQQCNEKKKDVVFRRQMSEFAPLSDTEQLVT